MPASGWEQIQLATATLVSVLDERQRRLYAGLESLRHGHGGDLRVAAQLGMAPATVAKGRKQLLSGDSETDRVRKLGGGRKPLEKNSHERSAADPERMRQAIAGASSERASTPTSARR